MGSTFRMRSEAAEAFNITLETQAARELDGDAQPGHPLPIARRLAEGGSVRFAQVDHGQGPPWDSRANIAANHRRFGGVQGVRA